MRIATAFLILVLAVVGAAADQPPPGLVAVVGDAAVILGSGEPIRLPVPPGAVLLAGPGGQVLAPDPAAQRTTVLDVAGGRVSAWLEHAAPLHFGTVGDRAVVLESGRVRLVSYPDGAELASVEVRLERPEQVLVGHGEGSSLILDRAADGRAATLVAVALLERQVSYRTLPAGVTRVDLAVRRGLLALADADHGTVHVVHPAAAGSLVSAEVDGTLVDVALLLDGTVLVAAVADGAGGHLARWRLKHEREGLEARALPPVDLPFSPRWLAPSPDRQWLAVAGDAPEVLVIDPRRGRIRSRHQLPSIPRQLLWPDVAGEAPLLPQWSEGVR